MIKSKMPKFYLFNDPISTIANSMIKSANSIEEELYILRKQNELLRMNNQVLLYDWQEIDRIKKSKIYRFIHFVKRLTERLFNWNKI